MLKIEQQKITLTKGDTAFIRFAPIYKDGTLYTTEVGDRAIFRLRENKILIEIECSVDIANNEIIVAIQPTHTANLKTGIHKYEVELLTGDGNYYTFIADQPFIIGNELEMHESGPAESILLPPVNTSNIPTITGEVEGEPPVVSGVVQEGRPSQDYNRLYNKPTLNGVAIEGDKVSGDYNFGTAADLDVAEEGDASAEQVVKGDDTRLSDARPASDVSDWAKAPNKPQYTKAEVGLGNVDNTSDAVKKSDFTGHIAQGNTGFVTGDEAKSALDYKLNITQKGAPNGLAELDSSGKVLASQLPSYVDGTTEGYLVDETHFYKEDEEDAYYWNGNFYEDAAHTIPIVPKENVIYTDITTGTTFKWDVATSTYVLASRTLIPGEADKIYVDLYSNKTYRWSGTIFVEISKSLALGTNDNCAYYGGKGQQAYEHATEVKISGAVESGLYKVAGTSEGHIGSLTPVEKADITALGIPAQDTTYENATAQTDGLMSKEDYTKLSGLNEVIANPGNTSEALTSIGIGGTNYSIQGGGGGGAVNSVNGKVGDVVLDASDVGALPDDTPLFSGSYNDLTDKPTLADLSDDSDHRTVSDAEKTQWNAAEANVQADWSQTTTSADDFIKNKPENLVQDANYIHTDNNFTNVYKTKLSDIEAGAEVNVQSDWNQTDSTQDDYIKNKPSIPDPQIQSDWNQTSGTAKDYIKNKPALGSASALDVATSGDASSTQVVKGDDSRLSDARTPVAHTHTLSEITDAGSAASKDSTSSVTAGSTDLVESGAVKTAIDNAISGAYKHAGTKTCAELISSLLIASNNGNVYNMTDSGTTTADFIEGAGIPIRAGDNVGIAKVGDSTYKFDLLSGFIDTSNFITKSSTSGLVKSDGSIDTTEYAPASSVPAAQIQSDWSQSDNTKLDYIKNKPTLGTASAKNVPASGNAGNNEVVLGNDSRLTDARNAADVYSWAKAENKPSYTKSEVGLGNVDNTSDATKKSNFTGSIASGNTGFVTGGDVYSALGDKVDKVEGKGLSTNDYDNTAKGIVDNVTTNLASKVDKVEGKGLSTNDYDNTAKGIVDGVTTALGNKTDKVSGATAGNFAALDENGNLTDSGHKHSDYLTSHQDISGKADKVSGATNGNLAGLDANGNLTDSGVAKSDIDNIEDELSTGYATVEGNPLNFNTLSAQKSKSTILSLEPIQDLHGYDKPWVGGAGKNKLPLTVASIKASNTKGTWSGNAYTYNNVVWTILTDNDNNVVGINSNGTANENSVFYLFGKIDINTNYILNGCPSGGSKTTYRQIIYPDHHDYDHVYFDAGSGTSSFTKSDASKDFECRCVIYNGVNVQNKVWYLMIRLSTESDATFQPYTNIAAISGRSEIGILGWGENLFGFGVTTEDKTAEYRANASQRLIISQVDSKYDAIRCTYNNGQYSRGYIIIKGIDGTLNYSIGAIVKNNTTSYSPSLTKDSTHSDENQLCLLISGDNGSTSVSSSNYFELHDIYVYADTTKTTYEPYQSSNSLTIAFGQTVYGGTLDVENGVLAIVDVMNTYDGSEDENWSKYGLYSASEYAMQISETSIKNHATIISNYLQSVPEAEAWGNFDSFVSMISTSQPSGRKIITGIKAITTVEAWKTYLASNPLQVCYELATPITINLTPHTINLLKGVNNISTDGDKITLTYRDGKFATLDGAVPKMTFRGEDYTMGVDDIGLFLENLTKSTKTYIADPLLNFDGTVATYKKIMKQWFINNGVNVMDSTGITYLCERWYEITKQGWKGGTSFPAVGVSTGSTGTRFDDNVGMSVTPSTDTSANTDTYQGLPLFAITDCNWELDSDGNILITAIDGITDNFVRDDPTKFVGVMQQTGWVKKVDDASTQKYYYADDKDAYEDLVPLPEAIKLNGTVRSFVVHAKYMSGIVDSKMTCCSGVIPRRNISHNSLVTLPDNIGTQYSGGTSVDWSFLVWMQRIKYASLTSDGVLQGCCNYNYQYYVKVGETGVKRLILSSANGANLKVGSTITFGAYAGNADRGNSGTYSISGQDGAIITAIEDVTIDSTTYKAIYVDTTNTFDTVANGDATNGTTIVSTHHWVSGSCDNVKGNDGSPVSATNGVYPAKLQGIEYMVGGYEVFADVIMNISGGYYNPYYARKSTEQATSITSSMVQSTLKCAQPSSDAWRYIQKHGFDGEIFYPVSTGTSSSEYTKDGFYENGTTTSTGTREWLAFGCLATGSGAAGLSYLRGHDGLGGGGWNCVARLSCNGNRGILLTA